MGSLIKRKNSIRHGQGLVEFALILPVLLMLILGLIEVGRLMFIYVAVTNSSREGARYGSAVGDNGGGTPQYRDCAGIQNAAMALGSIAGISAGDITIQYDNGPGTSVFATCSTYSGDPTLGDRVLVTVTTQYTPLAIVPIFEFPSFPITSVSRRLILTSVPLVGVTPGGSWTSTATVTPGGPTFTKTSTMPPTLTDLPTDTPGGPTATETLFLTSTNTQVPTATSPPTNTPEPPAPPINPQVSWTKNGNKCQDIVWTWDPNPDWLTVYPLYSPVQYQTYIDGSTAAVITANDPASTSWDTLVDLNNNGTVTYGVQAVFPGLLGSDPLILNVTYECDKGNLIIN